MRSTGELRGEKRPGPGTAVWRPRHRRTSARVPGPALQGLIALVIYLVVSIVGLGLALVEALDVPVVWQNYVDPNFYVWAMGWWPYAVSHGIDPLYTHEIAAPTGYNLAAWASSTPSVTLLMWPVTAVFGPIASFNLALLLAPPTAAWSAFVVARRLTGRFWAALPAGAVYGFNVCELTRDMSGWLNVSVNLLFPLLAYLVLRWWDGTLSRTGFVIWTTIAFAVEFYTFSEFFFDITLLLPAALVIGFAVAGRAARRTVARLAGLMALSYAGALVLASPYLLDEVLHMPAGLTRNQPYQSMPLVALILPQADRVWGLPAVAAFSRRHPGDVGYVGIPLLVLLLVFAAATWSSRVTRLLVAMFAVILALAVGPDPIVTSNPVFAVPWSGLWNLPIMRSAEANRFILFGYLVLAIVLALWLAAPARNRVLLTARWGLAVLAVAAIFADLPTFADSVVPSQPPSKSAIPSLRRADPLPAFITDGLYRRYLNPGETVVVLSDRGNAGMLFQADTDFYFRNAGGFINASLNSTNALPQPVALLMDPTAARKRGFLSYIRAAGVGAIIVERAWSQKWMYIFARLGMQSDTVGGVTLYRTNTSRVCAGPWLVGLSVAAVWGAGNCG